MNFSKSGGGCQFLVKVAGLVDFIAGLGVFRRARHFWLSSSCPSDAPFPRYGPGKRAPENASRPKVGVRGDLKIFCSPRSPTRA